MPSAALSASARVAMPAATAAFVAAISLSAFLLFVVQPMFAKMMLPTLGGAPAVWSVAMAFFQTLLLAGYAYAHLLARSLPVRWAAVVHLALLGVAFAALPIAMAAGWGRPPAEGEAVWLVGVFLASVGLPFFALSATGPLLQAWFAASGRSGSDDPYFLYAASNLGSFGALVAYPIVIEPFATLKGQSLAWSWGFAALAALIAIAAFLAKDGAPARPADAKQPVRLADRLAWIGLAFAPSGLLVAATAYISTDIAAAPMLWVAPLALYLLTFVLAFRAKPIVSQAVLARVTAALVAAALLGFVSPWPIWVMLPLHLALLFAVAMTAHSALYLRRPAASNLTGFYLCMSLGGVLGGAFCSLAAPVLFNSVLEHPILIVASLLCLPALAATRAGARSFALASLAAVSAFAVAAAVAAMAAPLSEAARYLLVFGLAAGVAFSWMRPERAVPLAAVATVAGLGLAWPGTRASETVRSFFGVHKIAETPDGRFLTLSHGSTIHGAVRLRSEDGQPYVGAPEPTTYYAREGALASALHAAREARGETLASVGVIGLGAGSLACHKGAGERWTFFEIDKAVADIALNGRFPFLRTCAPDAAIVLGDARLTVADDRGGLSLLVVDAFSSDAIPVHLVTREALALYLGKLDERGVVLFHITNRHLDLAQILARAGAELGLKAYVKREVEQEPVERRLRARSVALILTRQEADIGALAHGQGWAEVVPDMARRPWTDDFSNVIEAMAAKARL